MRIVSGKYRGKKLKEFDIATTRPTLDRVKESIFNLIQFEIVDAVVLDIFAGTGALGIEAISRGAKKTYLIDDNPKAINLIKENLKGIDGDYEILQIDAMEFLKVNNETFDIVLLDPPYATELGVKAIKFLIENERINSKGIIIFETSIDKDFDFSFDGYSVIKKRYGTVAVYKIMKD